MIDELVKVANAMNEAGIVAKNWHPKLKVLPQVSKKSPCVRVWLTADGHVKDVDLLREEQVVFLRKYEPDNGRSLPGFNVRPLYRLVRSQDECRKDVKEIEDALKNGNFDWVPPCMRRPEDDFWAKTRDGLERCFGAVREELEHICVDRLYEGEALQLFFDAVRQIDVQQFQEEYRNVVKRKVEMGELPLSLMCYFVTEEKKQKEDADSRMPVPKFSVFLDMVDYHNYPVSHEKTINRLNCLLMDSVGSADSAEIPTNSIDAYGLDAHQMADKFPSVALPFLGGVILRSQAKTIPAQNRYHQCESVTFPVGARIRERVKAALEWITDKKHDGETYGIAGDGELLFAYPPILPKDKIPFVKMFGAQPDDGLREDKFERLAESVIEQLKGLGRGAAEAELEIFSLRKMDKARTKVVYYRNTTVASLETASKIWHDGCRNIPSLDIGDWSEAKDEQTGKSYPVLAKSETVFPVKLHRYLNTVWKRNGEQAGKVRIFEPADGLRLLLEEPCQALAAHMVGCFMQHAQGYFLLLCQSLGKHEVGKLPDKNYYSGILGLLLFKLGNQKEIFMKESAFLLGRFLRVADEIHRLYCEVVRKKDLPPELCGSSMLVSMMEAPGMALDQLAMRSAPYVKWASAYHDDEKGGLVHYWMQQWSEIADQLHKQEWSTRMGAEDRAQVFLGYLASFPKREKTSESKSNAENTSNQGE
ncbi:MAG: hypothetical protein FD168_839 [Desulfobulbaceae bacterium]|nr:MAG: hypothetical protein FD168_839 [Desulfobulbaceae bacterium]